LEVAYTTKGIQALHGMSRLTMLGIMGVIEWWWWGGELSLVESIGCEIWHVLEACVICSWISGISGEQPTKTFL
jgi:hypothetical protein